VPGHTASWFWGRRGTRLPGHRGAVRRRPNW
jgi:hypothetical protein